MSDTPRPVILASTSVRDAIENSLHALHAADHLLQACQYLDGGGTTLHAIVSEALNAVRRASYELKTVGGVLSNDWEDA